MRAAAPQEKQYRLWDGGGLYLQVMPNGSKLWRLKYRVAGKEKVLAIGVFPQVGLAAARAARDASKQTVAAGDDPVAQRRSEVAKREAAKERFEAIARAWHALQLPNWTARHGADVLLCNRPAAVRWALRWVASIISVSGMPPWATN